MTIMAKVAIALVRGYQILLSPYLGRNCRFHPSCSQYAIDAIAIHGFFKGTLLSVRRLCKCAPWHPGGYDPVPIPARHGATGYSTEDGD